jgi:TonB family protein
MAEANAEWRCFMPARGLLISLLLLTAIPQAQPRVPVHVESFAYPPVARMARIAGDIVVLASIDSEGKVSVPVLPSGHPLLMRAAEENIRTWRFQNGLVTKLRVTYHFKIEGEPTYSQSSLCKFDFPDSVTIVTAPPKL